MAIAEVAHYAVESYRQGQVSEYPALFTLLEKLLSEGDDAVREAVGMGLFEDIQNIASHEPFGYSVFDRWLGPRSREAWKTAEGIWEGKVSLAGVIRAAAGHASLPSFIAASLVEVLVSSPVMRSPLGSPAR